MFQKRLSFRTEGYRLNRNSLFPVIFKLWTNPEKSQIFTVPVSMLAKTVAKQYRQQKMDHEKSFQIS